MARYGNWVIIVFWVVALGLSGCNTVRGAGKDIQRVGETIQETAR